jgi:starvation-inducible DNA-binding protein
MAPSGSIVSPEIMREDVKPEIGLSDKSREGVVQILDTLLCDEYVLYTKTRKYHWNVIGSRFHKLHIFLEKQYEELDEIVDEVAERAREIGGKSLGTLAEFTRYARLSEDPDKYPDAQSMLSNLLKDHETVTCNMRKDIDETDEKHLHDIGTNNFLSGLVEKQEKMAWMPEPILKAKNERERT